MNYKIKYEVFDNANNLVHQEILNKELTSPTVGEIKFLLNPGTYTNIKNQNFIGNGNNNLNDNETLNKPFIVYTINLN